MRSITRLFTCFCLLSLSGCASTQEPSRPSTLTYASVSNQLVKGMTTKNQVMSIFGPPNITTRNAQNQDVWTYDKVSTESKAGTSYWNAILLGANKANASQSASTTTLSVTFDQNGIVKDYDFYQTRY